MLTKFNKKAEKCSASCVLFFCVLLFSQKAFSQSDYPGTLQFPVIFYDYKADGSNPEFNNHDQKCGKPQTAMVSRKLGANRKPVINPSYSGRVPVVCFAHLNEWFLPSGSGSASSSAEFYFDTADSTWWYRGLSERPQGTTGEFVAGDYSDTYAYRNIVIRDSLPFIHTGNGLYKFERRAANNDMFFWLDNRGFGDEGNTDPDGRLHNFAFTMELHHDFIFRKGLRFEFSGDDDVWVFINDSLVLDLGGMHPELSGSVNLDNIPGLVEGETYHFDFFYCERKTNLANTYIMTNILSAYPSNLLIYADSSVPNTGGNQPLGESDSARAGERVALFGHVFDSALVWQEEYDSLVIWEVRDGAGKIVAVDTGETIGFIAPTKAGDTLSVTARFKDPDNPNAPVLSAGVKLVVTPGKAHRVDIVADIGSFDRFADEEPDSVYLPQARASDTLFAVVRDSYGNFIRNATAAEWLSSDDLVVTAAGAQGNYSQSIVTKAGAGDAFIIARETGLAPDTCAVVTETRAAKLRSAITRDADGDGYLDRIDLVFDTLVSLADSPKAIAVTYQGTGLTVATVEAATGNATADSSFRIHLAPHTQGALQTGWTPSLSAQSFGSAGALEDVVCDDGAGPVAQKALLFPGFLSGKPDSLVVIFSESVEWSTDGATPEAVLLLYDKGQLSSEALTGIGQSDMTTLDDRCRVVLTNGFEIVPGEDSVSLKRSQYIADNSGNQAPSPGRRVPVEWGVDNSIRLLASPNPFIPGQSLPPAVQSYYKEVLASATGTIAESGMIVSIESLKPLEPRADGSYGSALIYDAVGNVVQSGLRVSSVNASNFREYGVFWDGTNRNGRYAAIGTYLMIVSVESSDGIKEVRRVKLGVSR